MQHKTLYVCTGDCGDVSPEMKNCGAQSCDRFNQPLEPRAQCDACAATAARDSKVHICQACKAQ